MDLPALAVESRAKAEARPRRLSLIDLIAITSGFALAALLVRVFWPSLAVRGVGGLFTLGGTYLWLGLCMSGPLLLLLEKRHGANARGPEPKRLPPGRGPEPATHQRVSTYTRAEKAWMSVGAYWIGVAAFLIPGRLGDSPLGLLLVLELLSALGLWVIVPRRAAPTLAQHSWTHRLAIVLLVTWPLVWGGLIYLAWGR